MMKPTLEELSETLELNKADGKHDRAVYGEVKQINSDKTYQVSLNGSDTTVKCARLSGAKVGDTVMVELLANGYAVVTGTVGGDTDASDAQESADAAVSAAGQAQSAASAASTAAATAVNKADQASAAASAASTAAATADSKAEQAASAAATADSKAEAASSAASRAESSASAASSAASRAEGKADAASAAASAAQTSASNASEYAARALGNLASVESVAETLSWITAHGTMALTQDQQLDPTHVYFVQDNNGDYTVGGTRYSIVTEPDADDLSTYYELSIDQSLNNYVATHLAVDGEGLWLLPDAGGNKVLIATGAGSTYTTAGTYIIGKVNNTDTVFAKFASDGATMTAENGTLIAHLGYGQTQGQGAQVMAPYYTFGSRKANSVIGEYSVAEGDRAEASGYLSHAECRGTASGGHAHAEAGGIAAGDDSHAEGLNTQAGGDQGAHAEGSDTYANGDASHSEGYYTFALGDKSHAQNEGTRAVKDCQTAIGKYNVEDIETTASKQKAFIIGNGTGSNARSNAFSVDWEGYTEIAGNVWSDGSIEADVDINCNGNMSPAGDLVAGGDVTDGNGNVLGDKADASSVPTKTSDLTNDSGFTGDPTVKIGTGSDVSTGGFYIRRAVSVKDNISVTANSYTDNTTSVSSSGYTLMGVIGFYVANASSSGSGGMNAIVNQCYVSAANSVTYRISNKSSSAIKVRIYMDLLYFKN